MLKYRCISCGETLVTGDRVGASKACTKCPGARMIIEETRARGVATVSVVEALQEVADELVRACEVFKSFGGTHEGYGATLQAVDELWDTIKSNPEDTRLIRQKACAVAAMATRIMVDLTEGE